jgi:hypothetical protein
MFQGSSGASMVLAKNKTTPAARTEYPANNIWFDPALIFKIALLSYKTGESYRLGYRRLLRKLSQYRMVGLNA